MAFITGCTYLCNIFCINDEMLNHIIDALPSIKQPCFVPGPEMEILWSGTPGAAKKVSIKKKNWIIKSQSFFLKYYKTQKY